MLTSVLPDITSFISRVLPRNTADFINIALVSIDRQLLFYLISNGYLPRGFSPRRSLAEALRDTQRWRAVFNALREAESKSDPVSIIDAIFWVFGIDPAQIRTSEKYAVLRNSLRALRPLLAFYLGDNVYDQLYGFEGSKGVLAKVLVEAFYPYGVSPKQVDDFAEALHAAFRVSPELRQGYSNDKVARIVETFLKHGLLPFTSDLSRFTKQVISAVKLYRFVEDYLSKQVPQEKITDDLIIKTILEFASKYPVTDLEQLAQQFIAQERLLSRYPYGPIQAGIQATGVHFPAIIETPEGTTGYVILDEKLQQRALYSPVGSLIGATVRAVERMGARGPLRDFYNSLLSGKPYFVTPAAWLQMAKESGLSESQAIQLLSQSSANRAALQQSPIWGRVLRVVQYHYDIAPRLRALIRGDEDPEIIRGRISQLAESLGYRSIGPLDAGQVMLLMHSPFVTQKALEVLTTAFSEAQWMTQIQDKTRTEPLRRISQFTIERMIGQPKMTMMDLLNIVKPEEIKKIPPYLETIKGFSPFEISGPPEVKPLEEQQINEQERQTI